MTGCQSRALRSMTSGALAVLIASLSSWGTRPAWGQEPGGLEALALSQFPVLKKLTECERTLLRKISTGDFAYCGPNHSYEDPVPADCGAPGNEYEVHARLIRWICVDPRISHRVDPRGIRLHAARIPDKLDLSSATLPFPLFFKNCRFAEAIDLSSTQAQELNFAGSRTRGIAGENLTVRSNLSLKEGFRNEGEVVLLDANVGGVLYCQGGTFRNRNGPALSADRITVAGGAFLRDGFRAEGEVSLLGAKIGGDLDCEGGTFVNPKGDALNGDTMKVAGSVFLRDGFSAEGKVDVFGANIGSSLDVIRARFAEGSQLNAEGATVKGRFSWTDLGPDVQATLNLSHASVGPIIDDWQSWPKRGNLRLDGLVYERIGSDPTDAESRLDWLGRQGPGFTPQPYEQLARVLRERGDGPGARRVLIEMENAHRRYGNLSLPSWVWSWVLKLTIGYGYRPWYALLWSLGIVVLGTILFGWGSSVGVVAPSDKYAYDFYDEKQKAPPHYQPFSALVYSLDAFLPIINLRQKDYWMPNPSRGRRGTVLRFYLWLHIGSGWLLSTLFVAGFTSAVRTG